MYFEHHYWGMHAFWWIFWALLIVALVYWAWPRKFGGERDRALEELRRRYAAGEIDDDEYNHRLEKLTAA